MDESKCIKIDIGSINAFLVGKQNTNVPRPSPHHCPRSSSRHCTGNTYSRGSRELQSGAPTTTPPLYVDSCKREVSRNRDEDFGDEEDDDEAEDENVLPNSQEVFITLDPIPSQPSQGGLPDLEGGEDTSALVQHLAKIKLKPLETREDLIKPEVNWYSEEIKALSARQDTAQQARVRTYTASACCAVTSCVDTATEHGNSQITAWFTTT
ncbi:hypothetical protein UY3_05372 [Chelonia mydas]|uniref:Uncharacterized protein n=1 Tax=Chelonia mydas TaxID=8469 RepID=M7BZF4_CHEMY|nr:hypothetical protein UY3_05372 [Chelonia mydas]